MTAFGQLLLAASYVRVFDNPNDLRTELAGLNFAMKVSCCGNFKVRLTRARLNSVVVFRLEEASAREVLLSAPCDGVLIILPAGSGPPQQWCGFEMRPNDIVVGGAGEILSHKTSGRCRWSCAILSLNDLLYWSTALSGCAIPIPTICERVRSRPGASRQLRQIASKVCRLVENDLNAFRHPEIQRSLEQEFLFTLVNSLSG
jgi:hypothetical protein